MDIKTMFLFVGIISWTLFQIMANGIRKKAVEIIPNIVFMVFSVIDVIMVYSLVLFAINILDFQLEDKVTHVIGVLFASIMPIINLVILVFLNKRIKAIAHGFNIELSKDLIVKMLSYFHRNIIIEKTKFCYLIKANDKVIDLREYGDNGTYLRIQGFKLNDPIIREIFDVMEEKVLEKDKFNNIKYLIIAGVLVILYYICFTGAFLPG